MFKDGATESDIIANLRGEFLEDAGRRIGQMRELRTEAARSQQPDPGYVAFKAELHTMKGMGQSFGFASITVISRRLEQVLSTMTAATFVASEDITPFLDAIAKIVEAGTEVSDDALADILDGLLEPPPEPQD